MFYLIDAATNDVVEGGKVDHQRPPWLGGCLYHAFRNTFQQSLHQQSTPQQHQRILDMQGCQCTC